MTQDEAREHVAATAFLLLEARGLGATARCHRADSGYLDDAKVTVAVEELMEWLRARAGAALETARRNS